MRAGYRISAGRLPFLSACSRRRVCALLLVALAALAWQTLPQSYARIILLPNFSVQALIADEHSGRTFVLGSTEPAAPTRALEAVTVLDSRTGTVLRTLRTALGGAGARCCAMWALVDSPAGTVAVGGQGGGAVYLLDERDSAVLGTAHDSSGLALLPGDPAGHLLNAVASPSFNGVRVLDGRSGRTLRSIPCPASMATGFQFWVSPVLLDGPRQRLTVDTSLHRGFVLATCPTADQVATWLPTWVRDRLPGLAREVSIPASTGCLRMLDTAN